MSGHGVHVHGPHDHAVEHAAQHGGDLGQKIAIFTAVLATVGAIVSFLGGHTQNEALLFKNEAVLKKAEASNQWNYYQAKSSKQNLAELAVELAPESRKAFYGDEIKRYKQEKDAIKKEAEKFEAESADWSKRSDEQIHQHHRWAQATTALQISIAMAAIALLTKSRRLQVGVYALSAIGIAVGILAWLHI